jgi:hypothetical protein
MGKTNKVWQTPQLIILARGMPEENVLTACKAINAPFSVLPENYQQSNCADTPVGNCGTCQSRGGKDS